MIPSHRSQPSLPKLYCPLPVFLFYRVSEFQTLCNKLEDTNLTIPKSGRGSVLHEWIKASLFTYAKENNLIPLPEFQPYPDKLSKRVDIIFLSEKHTVSVAFEIDKAVAPRSVEKLESFPEDVFRCVISFGSGRDINFKKYELQRRSIYWIDVSKRGLKGFNKLT